MAKTWQSDWLLNLRGEVQTGDVGNLNQNEFVWNFDCVKFVETGAASCSDSECPILDLSRWLENSKNTCSITYGIGLETFS